MPAVTAPQPAATPANDPLPPQLQVSSPLVVRPTLLASLLLRWPCSTDSYVLGESGEVCAGSSRHWQQSSAAQRKRSTNATSKQNPSTGVGVKTIKQIRKK
ncbi:hypothetical protein TcCL_NonESM10131 [Trypanosoma cruzi]|nr:hypothetical protein TcCL_Unassigned02802 [Trypanosoma cruzi]RNC40391.1 hypothetical protein TcCL_NonESM10131 [Trypanosoma cruzi]